MAIRFENGCSSGCFISTELCVEKLPLKFIEDLGSKSLNAPIIVSQNEALNTWDVTDVGTNS